MGMCSERKFTSVIVPVFNGADCIESCLKSLNNQSLPRSDYEILVIDDGSTDQTAHLAEPLCDRVVSTENRGPASARNTGVQHASGEIILFTDADCVPLSNWIQKMIEPFKIPDVDGVKGAYFTRQSELTARFVQAEYETKYRFMSQFEYIDFIDTYSAGFRRVVFEKTGGYDERFPGASVEDQEFSFRVAEAEFKLVFIPEARVYHRHAGDPWHYCRKKFNIGYWKTFVLKLHPQKAIKDTHTPQTLKLQLPVSFLIILSFLMIPWAGFIPLFIFLLCHAIAGYRETIQCFRNNSLFLTCLSPVFMWVRAVSLGTGLIWGVVFPPEKRFRFDLDPD